MSLFVCYSGFIFLFYILLFHYFIVPILNILQDMILFFCVRIHEIGLFAVNYGSLQSTKLAAFIFGYSTDTELQIHHLNSEMNSSNFHIIDFYLIIR